MLACYGIDVDAVAGWIGSYGGEDSPDDISRGVFAGQVGTHRLLDLFADYKIPTTWFIPGHSMETFAEETKRVVAEGHEVGLHGYMHENPIAMTPEQEEKILVKTIELAESFTGKKPVGYRAPWWEFSKVTNDLLLKHGVMYDSSLMHRDFECYYVRTGDKWSIIDYSKDPETWMKPMEFGQETDLIEIPANWYLDDLPPMMFIKKSPNSFGWVSPDVVRDIWMAEFDWLYREVFVRGRFSSLAVYPITIP
ncbi:MAG: polysaccharide deacetylase, partial [Actinobacteria bacterium]|nr:polysaccharide deacetylase [Actinomycetota bacterium]